MRFIQRISHAMNAFRDAYFSSAYEPDALSPSEYDSAAARLARYRLFWSFYENNAFVLPATFVASLKSNMGLYRHIRSIYNPAYRLGEFWSTHLLGGSLDPDAGDGMDKPSAIPIEIADDHPRPDDLRRAIARFWEDSNLATDKDVWTLQGAVLGDAALKIIDDPERGIVYADVIHPAMIAELVVDNRSFVKAYALEYPIELDGRLYTYRETAERGEGDAVLFRTYRDRSPYGYSGAPPEWEEPYGFIPFVAVRHRSVGRFWGQSVLLPSWRKIAEANDQASKVNDHIRKMVDPPWFITGVRGPEDLELPSANATTADQVARQQLPAFYATNENAKASPMTTDLNVAESLENLRSLIEEIERDYPELRYDRLRSTPDASGEALRRARQPAEAAVRRARAVYDDALRRTHQMAIAIGGASGYPGYDAFDLASYDAGLLDHRIGDRPVFATDEIDRLTEDKLFYETMTAAVTAGIDPAAFLAEAGWDEEKIRRAVDAGYRTINEQ